MEKNSARQSTLDGNSEEAPEVYVEKEEPQMNETNDEMVLRLLPGLVGRLERADGSGLDGLPIHDDFYYS